MALTASFTDTNAAPALSSSGANTDLTTVGGATSAGLQLLKTVDRATAAPGDAIVYIINYANRSSAALADLRVYDTTPAYTVFSSAACGTTPASLGTCSVNTAPAAGATGAIEWRYTRTLASGASGTVTFTVIVQ